MGGPREISGGASLTLATALRGPPVDVLFSFNSFDYLQRPLS